MIFRFFFEVVAIVGVMEMVAVVGIGEVVATWATWQM
jgi:hypothetical protein